MRFPLDPYSAVVDTMRRWTVDWYAWIKELTDTVTTVQADITDVKSRILYGETTFAASFTANVVFDEEQPDTDYTVIAEGMNNNYVWPSAKTTTGFTWNANFLTSDTVRWILVRPPG